MRPVHLTELSGDRLMYCDGVRSFSIEVTAALMVSERIIELIPIGYYMWIFYGNSVLK